MFPHLQKIQTAPMTTKTIETTAHRERHTHAHKHTQTHSQNTSFFQTAIVVALFTFPFFGKNCEKTITTKLFSLIQRLTIFLFLNAMQPDHHGFISWTMATTTTITGGPRTKWNDNEKNNRSRANLNYKLKFYHTHIIARIEVKHCETLSASKLW